MAEPFYVTFTTTRQTRPDPVALLAAVRSVTGDPSAVLTQGAGGPWRGKKAATWSAGDLSAVQNALDTTAVVTAQLAAQRAVDVYPIEVRAFILTLLDEINRLRTTPTTVYGTITPATALAAVRTKAGTL